MNLPSLSRRRFVVGGAVAGAAWAAGCTTTPAGAGTGRSFRGPVGLQLYSLRTQFQRDVPGTVAKVASYGIHEVELAGIPNGFNAASFGNLLKTHGLVPVSGHTGFERFRDKPEEVLKEAQALGLKHYGCAWIPHQGKFDAEQTKRAAAGFEKAGAILAKEGIGVFYHCHGFEFEPGVVGSDRFAMDILMQETDPRHVGFQMDILWITYPGQDPAAWFAKYPGRWQLVHLKDLKKGVPIGFHNGGTDPNNDVVLGTGQMNWPKILAAAKKSGVKHYFIEDESVAAPEQIPQSLKYLETVRF
jgi:sugar phosphate isomerase/epimerase